jgi:hypothetical protein
MYVKHVLDKKVCNVERNNRNKVNGWLRAICVTLVFFESIYEDHH